MLKRSNNAFISALEMEIKREERIRDNAESVLRKSPSGYLSVKHRKSGDSFYRVVLDKRGDTHFKKEMNISDDWHLIWSLFEKKVQDILFKRTNDNLRHLHTLQKRLKSVNVEDIIREQAESYGTVFYQNRMQHLTQWLKEDYEKAPFDPSQHTRVTDCGILVRSKSEQLLVNTLYAYGIPFRYEEQYHYRIGNIGKIYPDITILLPNGDEIIWEHLGMLSKPGYCSDTADKLNIFQMNGLILNKNLILTMDDHKMNFGSDVINDTIKKHILPHFEGIDLMALKLHQKSHQSLRQPQ